MRKNLMTQFILAALVVISFTANAQHSQPEHGNSEKVAWEDMSKEERTTEVNAIKQHHLLDDHDFTITHGVSFPLPVILWDNGLQVFMSSKFHHGETVAEVNGNFYKVHHSKIYKTDSEGTITMDDHHHPTNAKPFDLSITKNVFVIILMALFMFFLFKGVAKAFKSGPMPTGAGRFLEPLVIFVRDEIAIPNIGKKQHGKYMSFLLTVFFFIWFLNLAGMTPLGIGVTNNIAITFSLAILTFFITQFTGKKTYWLHLFDPLGSSMPWVAKVPLYILLVPIELLGTIVKPFSLMIRLYANMTAGHIVLMSILGLIFVANSWLAAGPFSILTFLLSILELLVAALQAYIFTMLSALYFGAAAAEEHH
ncbi:MAG: F0F1 ATP synthase subunit A [Vicingaceae bacterium]|nr:F0F1 ATP synthase subunit A [Vicingaceae bacterium]